MALRIDQERIVKYSDKAFLAAGAAFVVVAAVMLVLGGQRKAGVTYARVVNAHQRAEERMQNADKDEYISSGLLAGDARARFLFENKPDYSGAFINRQLTKPPEWIKKGAEQLAPYMPLPPPPVVQKYLVRIPDKRVAPADLMLRQFKGYYASGKEKDGIPGRDLLLVTGQARVDLGQQTLWSRKAANVDHNPKWNAAIQSTVLLGYDVQRRAKQADGSWSPWEDRMTVQYENVNPRRRLGFERIPDGDPKVLFADEKAAAELAKRVAALRDAVTKKFPDELLHPPFYPLAGVERIPLPYDVLPEEAQEGAGIEPAGDEEPVPFEPPAEYEYTPPPDAEFPVPGRRPGVGRVVPAVGPMPTFGRETEKTFHFHDLLSPSDVGKTLQYRVRVRFLNPIFGAARSELDPEHVAEAWVVEVPGPYGEPSDEITIDRLVRFFFVGRSFGDKANFKLYRWIYGDWREIRSAAFGIGESINISRTMKLEIPVNPGKRPEEFPRSMKVSFNTGAAVVDVMTTTTQYHGVIRNSDKLVYWESAANRLESRMSVEDRDAATRFLQLIKAEKGQGKAGAQPEKRPREREPGRRPPHGEQPMEVPDIPDIGGPGVP